MQIDCVQYLLSKIYQKAQKTVLRKQYKMKTRRAIHKSTYLKRFLCVNSGYKNFYVKKALKLSYL